MANFELQITSRLIREGKDALSKILDFGVTLDDFRTHEGKAMYSHLLSYYNDPTLAGSLPGINSARHVFPTFELCDDASMATEKLCAELRKNRLTIEGREVAATLAEGIEGSPQTAISEAIGKLTSLLTLSTTRKTDVHFEDSYEEILEDYLKAEAGIDTSRCPYPWATLQRETGGIQPDDYIVYYGRPKCVPASTRVLSKDGSFQPITSVRYVLSLDHHSQTFRWGEVLEHMPLIRSRVIGLETETGYRTELGIKHPVLRPDLSYTPAGELQPGDLIGVVKKIPAWVPESHPLTADDCELLGLLAGDGNTTRNEVQFTKKDEGVVQRVAELVQQRGCTMHPTKDYSHRIVGAHGRNPILDWLRTLGAWGKKSPEKTTPERVFRSTKKGICAFLGGLLSTDGSVTTNTVLWPTASPILAQEIKHLLLRLGVTSTLRQVTTNYGTQAYIVSVHSQEQHEILATYLLPFISAAHKSEALQRLATIKIKRKRHNDSIPKTADLDDAIMQAYKRAGQWPRIWGKFSYGKLFRRTGKISRSLLRTLAEGLHAPELLAWADADVRWERVEAVHDLGEQDCVDIAVDGDHNFVVGDIVTHNSKKSWILAFSAAHAYLQGKSLLLYTKEMTTKNIFKRVAACLARLPYRELRQGNLGDHDRQTLFDLRDYIQEMKDSQRFICLSAKDAGEGGDTIPWLRSKVEKYRPDLQFVDGLYLMSDHRGGKKQADHSRMQSISRDYRQLILDTQVPGICTLQANRKAAGHSNAELDEIAFSDAIGQDATIAARVIAEKQNTIAIVLGGSREFQLHGLRVGGTPAYDFEEKEEMQEKDIAKAKQGDNGEEGEKLSTQARPRRLSEDHRQQEALLNAHLNGI